MNQRLSLKKSVVFLFVVYLIQILSVASMLVYSYFYGISSGKNTNYGFTLFLFLIVLTVVINSILVIRYIHIFNSHSSYYDMLSQTNNQLEKLNNTLRAQRHDFMNHLQVVYSLIEMDEYRDAKDYIEKIYADIQKVNKILKTSNPAVNALLQAKMIHAEKQGINVKIDIRTHLKDMSLPAWELCRVLSNIIDNAIYALQYNKNDKLLNIELFEDLKSHSFTVSNNGPRIDDDIIDKIFDAGFTTKGDKGDGMGLAITKEILAEHNGAIEVKSSEALTIFEGYIPKSA